jgi:hypothetical protein
MTGILWQHSRSISLHLRADAVVRLGSPVTCLIAIGASCPAELSQKVGGLEAAAVFSDAKASHEQRMTEINASIAEVQQEVQRVNTDIR